jgi:uncharacterized protein DUF6572
LTKNAGIHNPKVIDVVTQNPKTGRVYLIMVQTEAWDDSEAQVEQLKQKAETYLAFALDGQLVKTYPEAEGSPVTIQLDYFEEPPSLVSEWLSWLREQLQDDRMSLELNRLS